WRALALLLDQIAAPPADRVEGIVIDLAPRNNGNLLVEEIGQPPQNPAFCLAAKAEENHVVPREDRIEDLRNDRLLISDNPGKNRIFLLQLADKIRPHFILDRSGRVRLVSEFAGSQIAQG